DGLSNVADALVLANRAGMPAQNLLVGDAAGHIGWTIAGPLPARQASQAGTFPLTLAGQAQSGWTALADGSTHPRLIDPEAGQLWTANSRQLAGSNYAALGDGGADLGARSQQIRDDLTAIAGKADERASFAIGFDDRAIFLGTWRERALKLLDEAALANHPRRAEFRQQLLQSWDGHASVGSVGYRLTRGYMHAVYEQLFSGVDKLLADASHDEDNDFSSASSRWPVVVARLLDEQPAGWLPARFASWRDLQLAAVDTVIGNLGKDGKPLAESRWGARNTAKIAHPFTRFLPWLGPWLAAPADELAGDSHMPRVAAPQFGASERMVVSPGREAQGIFNMPGGQSGHPLSPYFLAGHAAWVKGEPTPFLPGPAQHRLRLLPAGKQ
ncbi:penicillin acylase family protein, partial [Chitinimonas sp.]|uniref:penicillin acylase family protein n=1 Tax=Chitinimonas sp. TaxID=1934313 RepID=UPI0035B2884B